MMICPQCDTPGMNHDSRPLSDWAVYFCEWCGHVVEVPNGPDDGPGPEWYDVELNR